MSAASTLAPPVATPTLPPRAWFGDPQLTALTPFTVLPSGRVFGHLASFNSCHTASSALGEACVRAPRSRSAYAGFHLGVVTTEEGDDVAVGHVIASAPHADPVWGLDSSLVHYSHSGWVGADVRAGEDRFGIWVAGALRPDISPEQLRALKSSPLSGDWRTDPNSNQLELIAALAVNAPGFKVPRPNALIASATGAVTSMFAVGAIAAHDGEGETRRRALKLKVLALQVDGIRRGAGLPVPPTKPRPATRRNVTELAARFESVRIQSLIASMSTPTASVQAWQGTIGAEGALTGDSRLIAAGSLEWAPFPLPLRWAASDVGGHDGAVVVGRIDGITREPNGEIDAHGVIDLGSAEGQEVARLIRAGFAGGISMDLDSVDSSAGNVVTRTKNGLATQPASVTSAGRVRGATLVQIPAFEQAKISLVGDPTNPPPTLPTTDSGTDDSGSYAADDCGCSSTRDSKN